MGKYDRMDQVQYRNVLSVIIRAKINPSGNARMIKSAAASQEAAEYKSSYRDYRILCINRVPVP